MSHDQEDMDEIFRRMTDDLELDVATIPTVVVSSLKDLELLDKFQATKSELYARGEIINATTATGRDLQSQYHACLLEMKKRKLA